MIRSLVVPHDGALLVVEFEEDTTRQILPGKVTNVFFNKTEAPPARLALPAPETGKLPEAFVLGLARAASQAGLCQTAVDDAIVVRRKLLKNRVGTTLPLCSTIRKIIPDINSNALYRAAAHGHNQGWWRVEKLPNKETTLTILVEIRQ